MNARLFVAAITLAAVLSACSARHVKQTCGNVGVDDCAPTATDKLKYTAEDTAKDLYRRWKESCDKYGVEFCKSTTGEKVYWVVSDTEDVVCKNERTACLAAHGGAWLVKIPIGTAVCSGLSARCAAIKSYSLLP
jgi:hypothetical protein